MTIPEVLKSKNLKVTPQRMAIYTMLSKEHTHPTAETIYKSLLENNPSMSFATVYKTLDKFRNHGLVQELSVGQDSFRYDAKVFLHPHFICTGCGKVFDLEADETFDNFRESVVSKTNFTITYEQINFYGMCECCK